ncbi:metallophosphoesterase family protein [Croceibacterium selenioxidans]|nr:metallophosphoesterase family protein [Croceibacterium selenioxidans]
MLERTGEGRLAAAIPAGERVYAVGDIHGRLDLFEALVAAIEADDAASGPADTTVILLGDLVDRGPDSAGVIALARAWQAKRKVRILQGNHEEMFLRSFRDVETFRHFLRHGGRETVLSFGVDKEQFWPASLEEAQALMAAAVPADDIAYLKSFEDMIAIGDYLFVHAGIDPRVPIGEQRTKDLRWIREPFLSHTDSHGAVVVHGHTISEAPEDCGNRIGIDTGAFMSGRLTALVLEGTARRYIEAVQTEAGSISTTALAA